MISSQIYILRGCICSCLSSAKNHKYLNYINNNMLAIDEFVGFSNFQSKFPSQNDTM
jgi:hypothetical protein